MFVASILAGLAASGVGLRARQAGQQPVFRSRTDLVSVYVVAVDEHGEPVHGLRQEDFTLYDRKKPQQIAVFDEVTHEATPASPAFALPPTLKHDVASNHAEQTDRLVVVVVDDLHMYKGRSDQAKTIVRDLIDQLGGRTTMAMLFSSGQHGVQVTDDRALLLREADTIKGRRAVRRPVTANDNQMPPMIDPESGAGSALDTANSVSLQDMMDDLTFYKALQSAARTLHANDGRRKAFVIVSEGIGKSLQWLPQLTSPCEAPTAPGSYSPCYHDHAIVDMMRELRRANVATYAIDPRGEVTSADLLRECSPTPPGFGTDDPCAFGTNWVSPLRQAQQGLEIQSEVSGGFAVTNTNDFETGLRHIVSDLDNYYLLGFYPSDPGGNGFRSLSVQVDQPDVVLRFRQGYEVGEPPPPPKNENPLTTLALGVMPSRDLPMRVFATPFPGSGKAARVAVTVEMTEPRRELEDAEGRISDDVRYSVLVVDTRSGKGVLQRANTAHLASQRPLDQAAPPAVPYQVPMTLILQPGRYQVRASALSSRLNRGGSVYLDLDVPDFTKPPIALSGLVIGYANGPRVPTPRTATAGDLVPFVPSLDREFRVGETVRLFAEAARKGASAATSATIQLVDYTGRVVSTVEEPLGAANRLDARVPLAGIGPGAYVLRVTVSDGKNRAQDEVGLIVR